MTQKPTMWQRARQFFASPVQGVVRQFAAARLDRLSGDWFATASSINQELLGDLDRLRQRGRQLVNNNDYARKFVGMVQNNIIGPPGIRLQSRPEDGPDRPDKAAGNAIEAAWLEWSQACDVTGQLSLRDLCENLVGGMPSDGEFLVKIVKGADAGNRFNFALQVIDVDRIDTTFNGIHNGNTVIMGVEVNAYRKPVALHLFEAHPNDGTRSSRRRVRVSTEDAIHRFKLERAEQVRGIPWMAPSMLSLHHLGAFKLSALLAAEHGANHYGFFTTPDGQAPIIGTVDANGQQITTSQPGTYDTLPAGVGFTPHESRYPNETFGPFVKTTLQRIATGWRVAYHSLANDLEGVSFSSIRSGTLEERDRWSADQEWFIAAFMEPVFQAWLQTALLSGAITLPNGAALPASKITKFKKHEWQARRWDWVDPKSDMEAKILSVKAGMMSPQDLCSAMGYDFEDTLKSIAAAQKLAKEYDVSLNAYDGTPGAASANGNATSAKPADNTDTTQKALIDMVRAIAERGNAPITIQQPATQVNFNTKSIEESTERMLNQVRDAMVKQVEEMPIQIIVPEQAAPIVNVAAPIVRMTNATPVVNVTNEVPAAQVVVQHPTEARQTVERDKDGEIKATVTTYTNTERSA